jgi:hypothetical protein
VIVGLGVMPGKATASTAKAIAANLAGGALVAEGVKLASEKVLPMLDGSSAATSAPPMAVTHGMPFGHNAPQMGYAWRHPNAYTNYEIQSALAQYQRAAA